MSRKTTRLAQRTFRMETLEDRKLFCGLLLPQFDIGVDLEITAAAAQTNYLVKAASDNLYKVDAATTEADFNAASAQTDYLVKGEHTTPHKVDASSGTTNDTVKEKDDKVSTEADQLTQISDNPQTNIEVASDGAINSANVDAVMQGNDWTFWTAGIQATRPSPFSTF